MHNEEDVPNILAAIIPFILHTTLAHFYYLFSLLYLNWLGIAAQVMINHAINW